MDSGISSVLPSWSDRVVAAVAGLGMFLAALDISVNVALPSIANGLNADLQSVQWVLVAFIATRAGLVMGAGSFADRFGLRRVFIFGAVSYLIAMVTISLSPNLESVVGFRVLQGFGAGSFFAVSPALAARVFPADRRGLAMGFATASQALGMLAGTLGAGLLIQWFDWQVVFWGRIPFVLLALLLAVFFMSLDRISRGQGPSGDATAGAEIAGRGFDAIGAITLMGALLCLVIGLRLGRSEGWDFPVALALLSLAPVLAAGFWYTEGRAAWPVLPRWLLKNRGFTVSFTSMFFAHFGVFVVWFVFPFYIDVGLGKGSGSLGVMLAAMALFYTGLSWIGGWVCDRLGTGVVGLLGLAVLAAGLLFVSFADQDSQLSRVALGMAVVGSGLGLFQSAAYALMLSSVPTDRMGTGSAALSLAQAGGTVLSVAIVGGILALSQEYHLAGLSSEGITSLAGQSESFVLAFRDVFRLGAAVAGLGMIVFALAGAQGRKRHRDQSEE